VAITPGPLVAGPEPLRRRYGLLTAASGPIDLPEHGRSGGVRYDPVTCGTAHPYGINCYDGEVVAPEDGKPVDPNDATVEALPFAVIASIECGAIGYTEPEFEAKVRRRLENGEQGAVEEALWTGLGFDGEALDIDSLSGDPVTVTPADTLEIVHVVAALEDYAYRDQGYGYVAYIHAPVAVAAHAADHGLVVDEGNPFAGGRMRTPYGSVWVFGGGYPGTGTAGAAPPSGGSYMHITGQVQVWRSADMHVYPANQTMNRITNQRLLVAEREYAVSFDCFNGRALFDPLGGV
jgi:hypothetical protein